MRQTIVSQCCTQAREPIAQRMQHWLDVARRELEAVDFGDKALLVACVRFHAAASSVRSAASAMSTALIADSVSAICPANACRSEDNS